MSAVAIIRALLIANPSLIAVVPAARIVSGIIPIGTAVPCIGITQVVGVEVPHIDANSPVGLVDKRVQVTVIASSYPSQKSLLDLARKACNYQRGVLSGFSVVSVRRVNEGPDFNDREAGICMQSLDFSVLYYEPNT